MSYIILELCHILRRRLDNIFFLRFLVSLRRAGPDTRQPWFQRCTGGPGGGEGALPLTPFAGANNHRRGDLEEIGYNLGFRSDRRSQEVVSGRRGWGGSWMGWQVPVTAVSQGSCPQVLGVPIVN